MKSNNSLKKDTKPFSFKRLFTALWIFALCAVPVFAASSGDSISELDSWSQKILELFQSPWVKAILLVALIVEAIGLVLAGQQGGGGQILKKFMPWICGTLILLSASSICSYFLKDLSFEVACVKNQVTAPLPVLTSFLESFV